MKTGIVMGGDRVWGIYATGILDVLLEHGVKVDDLVGVSAGVIHGRSFVAEQAGRSIRYNPKYCRDLRHMSSRSPVATGDLVRNEFCYYRLPERLDPLDNDVLKVSSIELYATCMDAEVGRPVYHRCDSLRGEGIQWIRASAFMPLVFRIVETDEHKPLDGGVSGSIPAVAFRKMGFGRGLVILTRSDGYRKKSNHMLPAIRRIYRRYPEFIKTMGCRYLMYNRKLKEVRYVEAAGEIFIVRPNHLIKISRIENRPERVQWMYELGRLDGTRALRDIVGFLGVEPAVRG